jgi:DNA-binding NarL/FixJ family response regulator
VLTARSGEEAIETYRARRDAISLLVTDIELPEISGWDAFQKIREIQSDARALLVSGYLDSPMRARMLEAGAKGFLRKPYTLDEMLRAIREVLDDGDADRPASGESGAKAGRGGPKSPGNGRRRSAEPTRKRTNASPRRAPKRSDEGTEA